MHIMSRRQYASNFIFYKSKTVFSLCPACYWESSMYTFTRLCRSLSTLCKLHFPFRRRHLDRCAHMLGPAGAWGCCFKATHGVLCPAVVPRGSPSFLSLLMPITIRRPSWVTFSVGQSSTAFIPLCLVLRSYETLYSYYWWSYDGKIGC